MRQLTREQVHQTKIAELGLDPTLLDLTSIEAIASSLRRIAGFLCPCSSASLVRGIARPLRGLVDDLAAQKILIEDTLDAMVAYGDFLEQKDIEETTDSRRSTLLYAAPASFVARSSGTAVLIGIQSDQVSILPNELAARIEYFNHVRRLSPINGENLREELNQLGMIELSYKEWIKPPQILPPHQLVAGVDKLLDSVPPSREVQGLLLLDSDRPVQYYRGRWVEPKTQTGRYVARRSQAYGAPLWCYVDLRNGNSERLIDFPLSGSRWRGCDEAWRLQMAIDSLRREPQRFSTRPGPGSTRLVEFFSPVPMWARRRWDAIGEPVPSSGNLFAYKIPESELAEELRFIRDTLWIEELG